MSSDEEDGVPVSVLRGSLKRNRHLQRSVIRGMIRGGAAGSGNVEETHLS